jgi:hypothetical protein
MVPYKLQMFKDPFTNESAASMFMLYRNKGFDTGRAISMVLGNLNKGIMDTGRRKYPVEYNLLKYTDAEFEAKLKNEREAREAEVKAKALPQSLPKETWIQKGLFDVSI